MRHILLLVLFVVAPASAGATQLTHVPPHEATAGEDLEIRASISGDTPVKLRYRAAGQASYRAQPFRRGEQDTWIARIPGAELTTDGIEYYIASAGRDHFASELVPHFVGVTESPAAAAVTRELDAVNGKRARFRVAFETVNFGARTHGGRSISDSYHRFDLDFSYRVVRLPLYAIRAGITRLIGVTPSAERDETCDPCQSLEAGFRVGGWFGGVFKLSSAVGVDIRGLLLASKEGASAGGMGEIWLGDIEGSHVAFALESIGGVGTEGRFRLGWDTVPLVPMAVTVAVTDFPAPHRAAGVRLVYDAGVRLPSGIRLGGRFGYQGRDENVGGLTLGINAQIDF